MIPPVTDEMLNRARTFLDREFPQADAAFLGGSAATGEATPTSDLDVLIVLPAPWEDVAFVETTRHEGRLVEAFVYGRSALPGWLDRGRVLRRPVLDRLIVGGLPLTDTALTRELADRSRAALAAGPEAPDEDELRRRRYSLSSGLDDLVDRLADEHSDTGERAVLAWAVWRESAELSLLASRRWLGTGKWLLRELRREGGDCGLAAWADAPVPDPERLVRLSRRVLELSGGYLQEGMLRGNRPTGL